jgi:stage II sporulation protein D
MPAAPPWSKRRRGAAALALLAACSLAACSPEGPRGAAPPSGGFGPPLRVLVQPDCGEPLELAIDGPACCLSLPHGQRLWEGALARALLVRRDGELEINGQAFPLPIRIWARQSGAFRLRTRSEAGADKPWRGYRGFLDLLAVEGGLRAIHQLFLEEYLAGVVGREMAETRFSIEALKAQAIAARTFTLYHLAAGGPMALQEYFEASTVFQSYGGVSSESARVLAAVRETAGWSLTFDGKLFQAYYHSACGGRTASGRVFNEQPIDPLRGVSCGNCATAVKVEWELEAPAADLEGPLREWAAPHGIALGELLEISPVGPDEPVPYIAVAHSGGRFEIRAGELRGLLSRQSRHKLPSARFDVAAGADESGRRVFRFKGRGRGHGVGLCQHGAGVLGDRKSHQEILAYYYPGSGLMKLY